MIRSPMLAAEFNEEWQEFPVYASPKLDGIRAHVNDGVLLSRSGKPIRNMHVQAALGRKELNGLDGELVVGQWNDPNVYNATSSGIMSAAGEPNWSFCIFDDYTNPFDIYKDRLKTVRERGNFLFNYLPNPVATRVGVLGQTIIHSLAELEAYEEFTLNDGYEGVMIRSVTGVYKFGRSTLNQGYLLKVKRYQHAEAKIIGFDQLMHNNNEAFKDELGRTKRSQTKDGLIESGMLGAYIVESPDYEKPFNVSCGSMTHEERSNRWVNREDDMGLIVRFKHLPHGAKDVPRHPLFAGFRDADDMS